MSNTKTNRTCAWCRGPIPTGTRADALCCSVRCRQARHRFTSGVGVAPSGGHDVLNLAYADPPYPGLSRKYYGKHPDFAGEVDHAALIEQLSGYDGWALSTAARSLQDVLALCPPGSRVAAWVRGERPTRSAGPLNAWEPVIYWGGRRDVDHDAYRAAADPSRRPGEHDMYAGETRRVASTRTTRRAEQLDTEPSLVDELRVDGIPATSDPSREYSRRIDVLTYRPGARLTDPDRVIGAKPAAFCRWMFDLLGAQPQDNFTDIFAGSGGVARAWDVFASHRETATA